MHNILLLEDCEDIKALAENALRNYKIYSASSLMEANALVREVSFDLFIIDIELPDGSGFDFCQEMSNTLKFERIPKIILSSHKETSQKVFGFTCGADDYITKPFVQQEFVARVAVRLRKREAGNVECISNFSFDHSFQRCCSMEGSHSEDLELTPTEFRLLYSLVKNIDMPLSRHELVRAVWKANGMNIEPRGIDSHVSHLRKKLKSRSDALVSVYGQGYAFRTLPPGRVENM